MTEQSRPLAFWVSLVDRLLDERFAAALDEHGVTRAQWQLLSLLRRGPATDEQVLAATSAGESRPDEVAELVESGWVVRGTVAELTERGRTAADALAEVVEGIGGMLEQTLDPAEVEVAERVLLKAAVDLGWTDESEAAAR
jgi:hypothetical protein